MIKSIPGQEKPARAASLGPEGSVRRRPGEELSPTPLPRDPEGLELQSTSQKLGHVWKLWSRLGKLAISVYESCLTQTNLNQVEEGVLLRGLASKGFQEDFSKPGLLLTSLQCRDAELQS